MFVFSSAFEHRLWVLDRTTFIKAVLTGTLELCFEQTIFIKTNITIFQKLSFF